jgi:ubiquinone/menaquinone biosynthesis C-methylase UbiE
MDLFALNNFPETADIETSSEEYAHRFSGNVGSWFLRMQEEITLKLLSPYPGVTVLDVGGGHGQLTDALVRNGYRVTVLGSSEVCMKRIKTFVDQGRCAFKVGNLLNLPYSEKYFDVVISYRLLPHVVRWKPFLIELARVGRKAVMLDYPPIRSVNYLSPLLFNFKKKMEGNTRPYTCFQESEILNVFKTSGFVMSDRCPQFLAPMVIHRILKSPKFSSSIEQLFQIFKLTRWFGSPVILKLIREDGRA